MELYTGGAIIKVVVRLKSCLILHFKILSKRYFIFLHFYFARVKLLLNRQTGEAVAMKMVDTRKHPDASASVKKEVCIQKFLQHPHILRYFGTRRQNEIEYIFLEYAAGGELFDRIGIVVFLTRYCFQSEVIFYHLIFMISSLYQNPTLECF